MMSECPLAIRHKKGEYIYIGEIFYVLEQWSFSIVSRCFILYLHFLAHDVFLFLIGLFMIGGDTLMIYVSCFTLFIDLYL